MSSSYTQSQSGLDGGAEASREFEPIWEGRFQTEAMPEDFSYLLHKDNKYYCNVKGCRSAGKSFNIPTTIRKHMKLHYRPVLCPFYPTCGYRGVEQKCLRRHVKVNHRGWAERNMPDAAGAGEIYTCDICGGEFQRDDFVVRHRRRMHPE